MGIWYDFYLEKRIKNEKWMPLKYNDSECLYSVRSYGHDFCNKYGTMFPIGFEYMNEVFKEKNKEKYNNSSDLDKRFLCNYYLMDLELIDFDYKNNIHEYAGIISKNDYKKLQSYSDYSPKIIDEEVYAKFKDNIKENYIYHEWDTYYGEEYYLYELMPIINEILKENDLTINEVRLLCKIG
jgi:hypothetical protein